MLRETGVEVESAVVLCPDVTEKGWGIELLKALFNSFGKKLRVFVPWNSLGKFTKLAFENGLEKIEILCLVDHPARFQEVEGKIIEALSLGFNVLLGTVCDDEECLKNSLYMVDKAYRLGIPFYVLLPCEEGSDTSSCPVDLGKAVFSLREGVLLVKGYNYNGYIVRVASLSPEPFSTLVVRPGNILSSSLSGEGFNLREAVESSEKFFLVLRTLLKGDYAEAYSLRELGVTVEPRIVLSVNGVPLGEEELLALALLCYTKSLSAVSRLLGARPQNIYAKLTRKESMIGVRLVECRRGGAEHGKTSVNNFGKALARRYIDIKRRLSNSVCEHSKKGTVILLAQGSSSDTHVNVRVALEEASFKPLEVILVLSKDSDVMVTDAALCSFPEGFIVLKDHFGKGVLTQVLTGALFASTEKLCVTPLRNPLPIPEIVASLEETPVNGVKGYYIDSSDFIIAGGRQILVKRVLELAEKGVFRADGLPQLLAKA
ncbi:hypothetical protein [Thermofilum pendens]|nr:hypothetical protein [Thermofilum pendens]